MFPAHYWRKGFRNRGGEQGDLCVPSDSEVFAICSGPCVHADRSESPQEGEAAPSLPKESFSVLDQCFLIGFGPQELCMTPPSPLPLGG